MGCQITIKKKSGNPQDVFLRAAVYSLDEDCITLGGPGTSCPLHEYSGEPAKIQLLSHHYYFIPPENGGGFLVNGEPAGRRRMLSSGDAITTDQDRIRFYLQYEKAQIAQSSRILSTFTKTGVTAVLIIQFLFMFFLISWLQKTSLWERQQTRLNIIHRMDNLRRLYGNAKNFHTPLNEAISQEIFRDLTEQAHFVRRYSEELLPDQRRALLRDLSRYEEYYQWLSRPAPTAQERAINLDQAVINILNQHKPK